MTTAVLSETFSASLIPKLRLGHGADSFTIPDWAKLHLAVGTAVASVSGDQRVVAGLALPTRMFAAAFTLFGIALVRANQQKLLDPLQYFEQLCSLPEGTQVAIHQPGKSRKRRGLLLGTRVVNGNPLIYVRISDASGGNEEHGLPPSLAPRLEVLPQDTTGKNPFGTAALGGVNPLLAQLLPAGDAYRYVNHSNLDSLVLGRPGLVRAEVCTTNIAVYDGRGHLTNGTLQDLVKLRIDDRQAYHSHVLPPGHRKMATHARLLRPSVVVFDGASSFLRSRHFWKEAQWIVLLDRTDSQFQDASDTLNEHYLQRAKDIHFKGPIPPAGVELCLFER